ncbi:hypothetical protein HD806DRAFT_335816 [Xylariaceae sp. AK1471]|nr:hypothetical protein HD806DRAFT_335816 [Xylariaceae sp. AK1471]
MDFTPLNPSAAQTALAIVELLEMILAHVDQRTLLVSAQRVNSFWHDCILRSPQLQRKLFFLADLSAERTDNPLFRRTFWCSIDFHWRVLDQSASILGHRTSPTPPVIWPEEIETFSRLEASWRRMPTHQPPLHGLGCLIRALHDPYRIFRCGILDPETAAEGRLPEIRMGQLERLYRDLDYTTNWYHDPLWSDGQRHPHAAPEARRMVNYYYPSIPLGVRELRLTEAPEYMLGQCDVVICISAGFPNASRR